MKRLLTEEIVLNEVLGNSLSRKERKEVLEIAKELTPLFESIGHPPKHLTEGIFDRAKAKASGAIAGGKAMVQNLKGGEAQDVKAAAKMKMLNTRLTTFKKNIGTATAQLQKDSVKAGMADTPIFKKLEQHISDTLKSGPSQVEIKDSSLLNKAGTAARQAMAEKIIPVISKAVAPISKKMEALYQKSGPIKNFDDKYHQIANKFKKANPGISDTMDKFSKVALQHKGKATFIVGAMVALLTAAGVTGPAAPIVMGIGMRGIYGMLAGEPPMKSLGKAGITALVGKLVGGGMKEFFGGISAGIDVSGVEGVGGTGNMSTELYKGNLSIADDMVKNVSTIEDINELLEGLPDDKKAEVMSILKGKGSDRMFQMKLNNGLSSRQFAAALAKADIDIEKDLTLGSDFAEISAGIDQDFERIGDEGFPPNTPDQAKQMIDDAIRQEMDVGQTPDRIQAFREHFAKGLDFDEATGKVTSKLNYNLQSVAGTKMLPDEIAQMKSDLGIQKVSLDNTGEVQKWVKEKIHHDMTDNAPIGDVGAKPGVGAGESEDF